CPQWMWTGYILQLVSDVVFFGEGYSMLFSKVDIAVVSLVFAIFVFIMLIVSGVLAYSMFRPWFRAFLSGTPISLLQILAMKLRKTDANFVIDQGIAANQAGHRIDWTELESAQISGVELEKVVLAYITAKKRGDAFTFEEIVDAERESRLAEMLKR
ncbi:MAG: flotillin-like FloA family protein, partial [Pirellulaceae bacterium]